MTMNSKLAQLAAHRCALMNQAALQRVLLAEAFEPLSRTIKIADRGLSVLRYMANNPLILAGSLALAVAVRPNKWVKLLESGWLAWRILLTAKQKLGHKDSA